MCDAALGSWYICLVLVDMFVFYRPRSGRWAGDTTSASRGGVFPGDGTRDWCCLLRGDLERETAGKVFVVAVKVCLGK